MPNGTDHELRYRTVIRDVHGCPILIVGGGETTIFGPNDEVVQQYNSENIELVCGTVFNPAMTRGQNPVMLISVCERCRLPRTSFLSSHRPSHGLCSTQAGTRCHECGQFLCPRHAIRCRDGRRRCDPCVLRYRIRGGLCRLFFKVEK